MPAATSAKIQSGSPVNGSVDEAVVLPSVFVAPRTPPAGFAFAGLSVFGAFAGFCVFDAFAVTAAPFTPPAAAGVAEEAAGTIVACAP